MTEYEQQQVTEYYIKGYSIDDIMLLMPFTRAEIKAVIKSHGCEKRQKVTRGIPAMIMEDVRNGETDIEKLAEKYHRSKATIYRWTRTGHQKPHKNSKTALIVADLQKGDLSQSEIAIKYNVSRQAVFRCKKYL